MFLCNFALNHGYFNSKENTDFKNLLTLPSLVDLSTKRNLAFDLPKVRVFLNHFLFQVEC